MSKFITQWQFHFRVPSPFRDWPCWRKLPCPRPQLVPGVAHGSDVGIQRLRVFLPQLKTSLMGQSLFRTLKKGGRGFCWNWIANLFLHVPKPASFPVTGIIPSHWWWTGVRAEGNILASYESSSHERYRANSSHKDYGIGCLLLIWIKLWKKIGKSEQRSVDNYKLSVKARGLPW